MEDSGLHAGYHSSFSACLFHTSVFMISRKSVQKPDCLSTVIASAALCLDGEARSRFGDGIIEASKYGTTAFPIVFAAIIARALRIMALWRCEKGARLGVSLFDPNCQSLC